MLEDDYMTEVDVKRVIHDELDLRADKPVKMTLGQLWAILGAIGGAALVVVGLYFELRGLVKEVSLAAATQAVEIKNLDTSQSRHNEEMRKRLDELKTQFNEVDKRMLTLELKTMLAAPVTNTNSGQGGTVNMNTENERRELREKPELKTSELARLLGVTSETITNNIKKDSTGEPTHFEYLGKQYSVRRSGNTFVIENPQYEP
jgi:DNA-binding transcriptional regulator YiaG